MKKLLIIALTALAFNTYGQNLSPLGANLNFLPFVSSRIHSSDSVRVEFILQSSSTSAFITISQPAGQNVKYTQDSTWIGNTEVYGFWLKGQPVGNYSFTATGQDVAGNKATVTQSLTVVADPVCPVCPVCPTIPPSSGRITSWSVVQSGGIGRILVTYWDGTTALLP